MTGKTLGENIDAYDIRGEGVAEEALELAADGPPAQRASLRLTLGGAVHRTGLLEEARIETRILAGLARSAGVPHRRNCGVCHFFGVVWYVLPA